jgi:hypothetical protein
MSTNQFESVMGGKRGLFLVTFLGVTGLLMFATWSILGFVALVAGVGAEPIELSPLYVNYPKDVDEYVSAESYLAMGAYQKAFEQPQNVQVLTDLSTQEINGFMMNYFVAGLRVNCTYCHSLDNFGAEVWGDPDAEARKAKAREHLLMTQDLNRNWLANLDTLTDEKQPSGVQIVCATCHNGAALPEPWPYNPSLLPDFRLPLAAEFDLTAENEGVLNVNARKDVSLDAVQYQQNVMYHMNSSLNVGCTHCHNSRYFPERSVPAIHYAQNMLQMTQYLWLTYGETLGNKEPSCLMCHQQAVLPPGAAISADILPDSLVGD